MENGGRDGERTIICLDHDVPIYVCHTIPIYNATKTFTFRGPNPFTDKSWTSWTNFLTKFNQCTPVTFKHYWGFSLKGSKRKMKQS